MEYFEGKGPNGAGVKEKSVYHLNLDTPRIIIISSVIIGIVIISVLVGMNIRKTGETGEDSAKKEAILDLPLNNAEKELNMLANRLPGMEGGAKMTPDAAEKDKLFPKDGKEARDAVPPGTAAQKADAPLAEKDSAASNDILTKDNIKEIIPPVKDASQGKPVKKAKIAKADKDGEKTVANKKDRDRKAKKNKVVEVAAKEKADGETAHKGRGYVIQIGSYDNRSKADTEKARLAKMNYDAFVDKTTVGGKKYFRVRVGPIASKKGALGMLNDIQDQTKYKESYMVRE